jgi:hypothetical protein
MRYRRAACSTRSLATSEPFLKPFAKPSLKGYDNVCRTVFEIRIRIRIRNRIRNRNLPLRAVQPRTPKKQKQQLGALGEEPQNGATSQLVAIARETLELAGFNQPIDELIDAFLLVHQRSTNQQCTHSEALDALNVALAERRRLV